MKSDIISSTRESLFIRYHISVSGRHRDSYWSTQTVAPRTNSEAHQQRITSREFQTSLYPNHETTPLLSYILHYHPKALASLSYYHLYITQNISTTIQPQNA
jgi:hypothetical protein